VEEKVAEARPKRIVIPDDDDAMADLVGAWLARHGLETVPIGRADVIGMGQAIPMRIVTGPEGADAHSRSSPIPAAGTSLPLRSGELVAWVDALQAARNHDDPANDHIQLGPLEIDRARRTVHIQGSQVHLTPTEFRLLCHIAEHPDRLIGHRELLGSVWGPGYEDDIHLLQVTMRSLRSAMAKVRDLPIIETVYGAGYRMACLHGEDEEKTGAKVCTCGRRAPGTRAS
jgi:DNA-binding winged helix-turn-helix (wHTH) protein